ncbi:MAG: tail fiber domain-containing protein, partial [Pirellulaceae bacterium]
GLSSMVGGGSSNAANGDYSTVAGGIQNSATGHYSFAAGYRAKALHRASFVWSDRSLTGVGDTLSSTADNQFLIRAAGGVGIGTNTPESTIEINMPLGTTADDYGLLLNAANRRWNIIVGGKNSPNAAFLQLNYKNHDQVAYTPYFTFSNAGRMGIGTTNPSQKLEVNGDALANAHTVPSDRRLKRNIQPVRNSLDTVTRLSGVTYEWRTDEYPDRSFEEGRHIGFIAQDVETVVPEAVTVGPDGTYSMRYQEIIPILVEAIKEQQETIDEQRGVIARLDDRLTALEAAGTN